MQSHCVIDERTDVWVRRMWVGIWVGRSAALYLLWSRTGLWFLAHGAPGTTYVLIRPRLSSWKLSLTLYSVAQEVV